ncbi:TMEM165/GDT1 family protein [Streptomyces sp. DSM 40750]|uniref:TMEM165/GDT1 family protein n=1 Tax=Streptomyces sp. DSM 40750 TaxID=2801030 RepID=UPI00214B021F|nr:TMEM165/GDT1 family protein [Streptomyces sp. DSM 40750]UUU21944.1 TMEM165/GDT1 family protein [Streptomyces sp. DSM 40750]
MPVFDASVVAITFGATCVTELPDKTAVAVLLLATRYRAGYRVGHGSAQVFLGRSVSRQG